MAKRQTFSVESQGGRWTGTAYLMTDGSVEYTLNGIQERRSCTREQWSDWGWTDGLERPFVTGSEPVRAPLERLAETLRTQAPKPARWDDIKAQPLQTESERDEAEARAWDTFFSDQAFVQRFLAAAQECEREELSFDFTDVDLGASTAKGWESVARNQRRRFKRTGLIDATQVAA